MARRLKCRAWRGRSVSEGWPRSPPLRGRCRRSRQRGVFMPRVASGWITPLCPAGHLLLKGGDWLHRRPTSPLNPERGGEAPRGEARDGEGGGCELAAPLNARRARASMRSPRRKRRRRACLWPAFPRVVTMKVTEGSPLLNAATTRPTLIHPFAEPPEIAATIEVAPGILWA